MGGNKLLSQPVVCFNFMHYPLHDALRFYSIGAKSNKFYRYVTSPTTRVKENDLLSDLLHTLRVHILLDSDLVQNVKNRHWKAISSYLENRKFTGGPQNYSH